MPMANTNSAAAAAHPHAHHPHHHHPNLAPAAAMFPNHAAAIASLGALGNAGKFQTSMSCSFNFNKSHLSMFLFDLYLLKLVFS